MRECVCVSVIWRFDEFFSTCQVFVRVFLNVVSCLPLTVISARVMTPFRGPKAASIRGGKGREERLVNFPINREQNLISACAASLCLRGCVCVCPHN